MDKCEKLLADAEASPSSLTFDELCALAECYGFIFKRQKASHRMYGHPSLHPTQGGFMNFQPDKGGKAKAYQVRQLLRAIENLRKQ